MYLAQWFSAIAPRDSSVPRALVKRAAGICIAGRLSIITQINTLKMKNLYRCFFYIYIYIYIYIKF